MRSKKQLDKTSNITHKYNLIKVQNVVEGTAEHCTYYTAQHSTAKLHDSVNTKAHYHIKCRNIDHNKIRTKQKQNTTHYRNVEQKPKPNMKLGTNSHLQPNPQGEVFPSLCAVCHLLQHSHSQL